MFTKREKTILVLLILTHFCLIVDFMILMPLGPLFMRIFNVGAASFGSLVAAFTLFAGLSGLGGTFFIDRLERKSLLIKIMMGFMASNFFCGFADQFWMLVIARAVTGFFAGVCGSLLITIVSDTIALEKRGTALGLLMSAFALASIIGVPVALWMANHWGWQSPFFLLAAVSFVLIQSISRWMPEIVEQSTGQSRSGGGSSVRVLRSLTANPVYRSGLLFMALLILGHFTINPFLFTSIVANGGLAENQLPMVYLSAGLASLVSAIGFGKLTDYVGRRKTLTWTLLASLIPIYLVTNVFSNSLFLVIVLVSMFFILMGGRMTPAMTLITSIASNEDRGRFLSCIVSVQHLATAGASVLAGAILVKTDDGKLLNLPIVGVVAIGFSLLALWFSRGLRENQ